MSPRALVTFPAPIRGLASWTLETIEPRARVYSLSFLPSRRRLAAGDGLGTIRIYENDTGRLECVLVGHEARCSRWRGPLMAARSRPATPRG